jgi:hypothetical protein
MTIHISINHFMISGKLALITSLGLAGITGGLLFQEYNNVKHGFQVTGHELEAEKGKIPYIYLPKGTKLGKGNMLGEFYRSVGSGVFRRVGRGRSTTLYFYVALVWLSDS